MAHMQRAGAAGQDKGYPRDFLRERDNGFMLMRGRARVKLFSEAGTPLNPDIPNREAALRPFSPQLAACSSFWHVSAVIKMSQVVSACRQGPV